MLRWQSRITRGPQDLYDGESPSLGSISALDAIASTEEKDGMNLNAGTRDLIARSPRCGECARVGESSSLR